MNSQDLILAYTKDLLIGLRDGSTKFKSKKEDEILSEIEWVISICYSEKNISKRPFKNIEDSILKELHIYLQTKVIPNMDDLFEGNLDPKEVFKDKTNLDEYLKKLFLGGAYLEEVFGMIFDFYRRILDDVKKILVVSSFKFESKLKKEIRDYYSGMESGFNLVNFKINQEILGGIQVFVNGILVDESWIGKINNLQNLVKM